LTFNLIHLNNLWRLLLLWCGHTIIDIDHGVGVLFYAT